MPSGSGRGPTPSERVARAEGSFSESTLTKTGGLIDTRLYEGPVVDRLDPDEHLAYLFVHQNKGLRVFHPDGDEETPHHSTAGGYNYLLVTDRRLCYVAGLDSSDETRRFPYHELTDVAATTGTFRWWLEFTTRDGTRYRFAETGNRSQDVGPAADYVRERIAAAPPPERDATTATGSAPATDGDDTDGDTRVFDDGTDAESGTRVFGDAGAEVDAASLPDEHRETGDFCPACGTDLSDQSASAYCGACGQEL